jgi:molybdate transport system ATP-binding protein
MNAQAGRAGNSHLNLTLRKKLGDAFHLDVEAAMEPGINIVFGASGAGKTTLLDAIAGLSRPDEGRIAIGGRVLFDSTAHVDVAVSKRRIGYVFQDLALFPHLTVEKNLQYGLANLSRGDAERRCGEILESFRIAHLRNRKPGAISGGERQRAALARALVTDPCVLLLDEPLAALDYPTRSRIIEDLRRWNEVHEIPVLYVTHSRDEVFALGECAFVLEQGKIVAKGSPHSVMSAPRQETVAQLSGFENIFDAEVIAAHEDRGTMTCRLTASAVELETPLVRAEVGARLRVGIRAGDILLATKKPEGLSARNVVSGKVLSLERRDLQIAAKIDCGVVAEVHLTLAARDSLDLRPDNQVWLVVKTYSCHLMAG